MRILAVSDLHGNLSVADKIARSIKKQGFDLIAVCGDITSFGPVSLAEEILVRFADTDVPVFFVPGNCDPANLTDRISLKGVHSLHGSSREVYGIGFMGVGGSTVTPYSTITELSEETLWQLVERAYEGVSHLKEIVLISHSPPKKTKLDLTWLDNYAGSSSIRRFLESREINTLLCGHVHEGRGTDRMGKTLLVNVGPASRGSYADITLTAEGDTVAKLKYF